MGTYEYGHGDTYICNYAQAWIAYVGMQGHMVRFIQDINSCACVQAS